MVRFLFVEKAEKVSYRTCQKADRHQWAEEAGGGRGQKGSIRRTSLRVVITMPKMRINLYSRKKDVGEEKD